MPSKICFLCAVLPNRPIQRSQKFEYNQRNETPFRRLEGAHENWRNCAVWWRNIEQYEYYGHAKLAHFYIIVLAHANQHPFLAEMQGTESISILE